VTITAVSAKGPRHLATVDRAGFEGTNAVGISGNTVVAGVPGLYLGSPGAVYLFTKPTTGWHSETQTAKLIASDGAANVILRSAQRQCKPGMSLPP
jgi:hypothetical protein